MNKIGPIGKLSWLVSREKNKLGLVRTYREIYLIPSGEDIGLLVMERDIYPEWRYMIIKESISDSFVEPINGFEFMIGGNTIYEYY